MTTPKSTTRRRILIVIRQFFPLAAGAETQALRQAQSYIRMGHEARVVTARHSPALPREDVVDGVPVTRLPASAFRFIGSILFLCRLASWLIRHRHEYDAVLVFHLKQPAMVASLLCRFLSKRVVISDQAAGEFGDVVALQRAPFGGFVVWGCRKAAGFVSGSSDITEELVSVGIPLDRIHFIPNGIPLDRFSNLPSRSAARESLSVDEKAFVAVNVGRHAAQKDLKTLLAAWKDFAPPCPRALLLLVGDGDEREELVQLAAECGVSGSVRFEGWRSNVADYLAAADVFASSSISEGTHIALGEAMAAGLPVMATPVGGARDFVRDGENGYLVKIGDSQAIAAKLEILATDATLRERMGKAARETAAKELEQEETAAKHIDALFACPKRAAARRRIRVAHVIATLDRGGSERQMALLAAGLDKSAFESQVFCLTRGGPTRDILDAAGVPYCVLAKGAKVDVACLWRLVEAFLRKPPDVVHTWLFTSNVYGRLAAFLSGVRTIVASERSVDPWKSRAQRLLDCVLALSSKRIVANSRAVADSLTANGIPPSKVRVIPNGIDTNRFRPRPAADARFSLGLPVEGPCFGYVGRLAFEKRPEVFIEAAKLVLDRRPEARAVIFGDGPMRAELEAASAAYRDRVTFYGDCPRPALAHAALDCLVLTSAWEGFPNAVLEAMSCGRPVVAVKMSATEELVEDGVTGLLVGDDVEELAAGVLDIIGDPGRAARMGEAAKKRVESRYSLGTMIAAYRRLYTQTTRYGHDLGDTR